MSMLAERRQKVKWVLNPRQTAWSSDSTKFGQKYLEKLGWEAGKGIGANLQGCTEHVKVSVRSDNRGVGFKGVPESVLPHQNDFSDLLAQLATDSVPIGAELSEEKSLEAKSRKSKARVHYQKFTRSKDLTTYSQKDLACILGKPARPGKDPVMAQEQDFTPCEPNFIQRGNMQAYFTGKMKNNCGNSVKESAADKYEDVDSYRQGFGFKKCIDNELPFIPSFKQPDDSKEVEKNVRKSKTRGETHDGLMEEFINNSGFPSVSDPKEMEVNGIIENKRKKRKRKRSVEISGNEDDLLVAGSIEPQLIKKSEEHEVKEPRMKQRVRNDITNISECGSSLPKTLYGEMQLCDKEEVQKSKKKRRKKAENNEFSDNPQVCESLCSEQVHLIDSTVTLSKKKSRKKQKYSGGEDVGDIVDGSLLSPTQEKSVFLTKSEEVLSESVEVSSRKVKEGGDSIVLSSEEPLFTVDSSEIPHLLENEKEIKISRKKQKRNAQPVEVESIDEACKTSLSVTCDDFTENVNKTKKKLKKHNKLLENIDHEVRPVRDDSPTESRECVTDYMKSDRKQKKQNKLLHESELKESVSRPKSNKKKTNSESVEMRDGDSCFHLFELSGSMESRENDNEMNENVKLLQKKLKKKTRPDACNPAVGYGSHDADNGQKTKLVQSSELLSNVILIPSQEQSETGKLNSNNKATGNDCSGKEAGQGKIAEVKDKKRLRELEAKATKEQRRIIYSKFLCNLSVMTSKPELPLESKADNNFKTPKAKVVPAVALKATKHKVPSAMCYKNLEYINGISKHQLHLRRRLQYSRDAVKYIPLFQRNPAFFDGFPGSNVEKLGYG